MKGCETWEDTLVAVSHALGKSEDPNPNPNPNHNPYPQGER